ncbi:hypothetical protein BACUNI_04631 [Bacteroides uniformis ATCC 8492]|uniref:Uncharacterized protein n=1 Tax=Bacteroides uniformis (strain ATCC 8492 / DSM 6597 / CCUG 4942 / CIP 103695 / JCM 5828 / KCTC 5204 / NCTC 13054 / VPI 0061) TaxID=411479 RepID=A0ABC9N5V3_BACUC|nr:hypothetical protein BACUNI_04631 [Bacteroides uniformis ATCC 8492]
MAKELASTFNKENSNNTDKIILSFIVFHFLFIQN